MKRIAGTVGVLLLVAAVASCGGDDDDVSAASTTTADVTGETTTTASGQPELRDEDVAGFERRAVVFANLTYSVEAAHVSNQDLRSYAEGTDPEPTTTSHLILDVQVENPTSRQIESDADAIALEIDGTTVGVADDFLTDATGFIPANEAVDGFLAFEIDPSTDPAVAMLVFGAAPDRPAMLPLTGDVPPAAFPVEVAVSGEADGVGPTNSGTIRFELLGATLFDDLPHGETTSPTGERADVGEVFVQLHVRATKTDGRGNDLLGDDAFALLVDGVPRGPFDSATAPEGSTPTPTAEPAVAVDAWVLFAVDAGAETYVLQVGDPNSSPGTIAVELPST